MSKLSRKFIDISDIHDLCYYVHISNSNHLCSITKLFYAKQYSVKYILRKKHENVYLTNYSKYIILIGVPFLIKLSYFLLNFHQILYNKILVLIIIKMVIIIRSGFSHQSRWVTKLIPSMCLYYKRKTHVKFKVNSLNNFGNFQLRKSISKYSI